MEATRVLSARHFFDLIPIIMKRVARRSDTLFAVADDMNKSSVSMTVRNEFISTDPPCLKKTGVMEICDSGMSALLKAKTLDDAIDQTHQFCRASYKCYDGGSLTFDAVGEDDFPDTVDKWVTRFAKCGKSVAILYDRHGRDKIIYAPSTDREDETRGLCTDAIRHAGALPFFVLSVFGRQKDKDYDIFFCERQVTEVGGPSVSASVVLQVIPHIMSGFYGDNGINWITGSLCDVVPEVVNIKSYGQYPCASDAGEEEDKPFLLSIDNHNGIGMLHGALLEAIRRLDDGYSTSLSVGAKFSNRVVTKQYDKITSLCDEMLLVINVNIDDFEDESVNIKFVDRNGAPRDLDDWSCIARREYGVGRNCRAIVIRHRPGADEIVYDGRRIGGSVDDAFKVIRCVHLTPFIIQIIHNWDQKTESDKYDAVCVIYCVDDDNFDILASEVTACDKSKSGSN